jgi:hypothetical protein
MRLLGGLAVQEELDQVIGGQGNSTASTTEDIGAGTLEESLEARLGDDLATSVDGRSVLDGLEYAGQCSKTLSGQLSDVYLRLDRAPSLPYLALIMALIPPVQVAITGAIVSI